MEMNNYQCGLPCPSRGFNQNTSGVFFLMSFDFQQIDFVMFQNSLFSIHTDFLSQTETLSTTSNIAETCVQSHVGIVN